MEWSQKRSPVRVKKLSQVNVVFFWSMIVYLSDYLLDVCFLVVDDPSLTLGELFLCGVGGTQLRRHLVHKIRASLEMSDQEPPLLWVGFFNRAVYILMDLMYPSDLNNRNCLFFFFCFVFSPVFVWTWVRKYTETLFLQLPLSIKTLSLNRMVLREIISFTPISKYK